MASSNDGVGNYNDDEKYESKANLAKAVNKQFDELDIDALIKHLKQSENQIRKKHGKLVGIDYDKIESIFKLISNKYEELIKSNLQDARSFEALKRDKIPEIVNQARAIADKAVRLKQKAKSNATQCYLTNEMINAASKIIPYVLALYTLLNAQIYYIIQEDDFGALVKATNSQIVAICCLLSLDIESRNELINNLVEVGQGDGKSLIMAITAATLALLDFDVSCASYSELLSKRDEETFNDLFILLHVQNHIHYQTFNNIFEQVINDGGDIREIAKNIVLAKDIENKSDDYKIDEKKQKILVIDEIDKFLSTNFFGQQYTPSCIIPSVEMKNLIKFVWNKYLSNGCNEISITTKMIEASAEYRKLLAAFNPEWHDLLKLSIRDIVDAIRTFKNDEYLVKDGRDVCYKCNDTYSSKPFYGYRTIFSYLYELQEGNITDESYVDEKLVWYLKCGSFSYAEIVNDFDGVFGLLSDLNSLSQTQHNVIQTLYGIKKYVMMPSLFDKTGKLDYAENRDINILKQEYFYYQLYSTIQEYQTNVTESINRPIIVFFKNENKLNDFYNLDVCETWRINDVIQKLTPALSEVEKKIRILNATKPNTITFATEEYGRGIDFKVFDKRLDDKGMHIELTYLTDTLAEEIAIKTSTARQGKKGSFHIILNEEEIIDQCNVLSEDIKKHQDNGDLYEWLNDIRNELFKKEYDEAFNIVERIKPIHKESQQLAESLRTKNVKVAKEKLLLFNKGANIQSAARLSILIDATASMGSCLTQCKILIQKTIPKLVSFLNKNGIDSESFEIQVIAYRNYNAPAEKILEYCPFTSNQNDLTNFIDSLKPGHGWGPEAVEVAFKQLNYQGTKPNIIMLMADAPAQSKQDIIGKRKHKQHSKGERYWSQARSGFFTHLDWKEELDIFMKENKDTNIFSFYLPNPKEGNNFAKKNFDEIAKIGNGKSMYLNVNNQKQSVDTLQGALSETLLLKINNNNMDLVNEFRKENKNIPTFL